MSGPDTAVSLRGPPAALWRRWWLVAAGWLVVVVLVGWQAAAWSQAQALAELRREVRGHLELHTAAIRAEIGKFRSAPSILARSPLVLSALAEPDAARRLSRELATIAADIGAATLYVLDAKGTTVAASNWDQPDSLVGNNFAYRPYFTAAMAGRPGEYYALGTTTNRPGYYVSMPIEAGGKVKGAAVIKISLDDLEAAWRSAVERIAVANSDGVVVASNVPEWRFHTLQPLDAEARKRIEESLQFSGAGLAPLPIRSRWTTEAGAFAVLADAPTVHLVETAALLEAGWTVHAFAATDRLWKATAQVGALAASMVGVVLWGVLWAAARALTWRSRLAEEARGKEILEERVRERTLALETTNELLRQEVFDRQRAETSLRETQGELVQAAKLAALGQMSASLAHELNQPLAAIRTFADNAAVLLERGRGDDVRANLREIAELTQRMASISHHLKAFARKSGGEGGPVDLRGILARSAALLAPRLRERRVVLRHDLPEEPLTVFGDEVRLGQVVVNLLQNAADAVQDRDDRRITVTAALEEDRLRLTVADSGPGFSADQLPRLFQSFFTTKPPGEGLGLGLSIARDIVEGFGGSLSAANAPEGGAVLTVTLKRVDG